MDLKTKITKSEGHVSSQLDGKTVILDLASNKYFSLNEVGAEIYNLIDESTSLEEISVKLTEEYSVDKETIDADLIELCSTMLEAGVVELVL